MTSEETRHDEQPRPEDLLEIGTARQQGSRSAGTGLDGLLSRLRRDRRFWAGGIVLVVLLGLVAVYALISRDDESEVDQATAQVVALEKRELQDLLRGDSADLDQILASDFETVTPDGALLARDDYLGFLASGDLVFHAFEPTSALRVRTDGSQAVVTFTSQLDVSAGKKHYRHRAWHTSVFEKSADRWQLVWSQTTAIGGFPPHVGKAR
jgi:hypothetical protein